MELYTPIDAKFDEKREKYSWGGSSLRRLRDMGQKPPITGPWKNWKNPKGLVCLFFQKSMKLKMWNYIHQSTRNSMRHTKNTVELGSRLRRLRDIGQKHPKTPKNVQKRWNLKFGIIYTNRREIRWETRKIQLSWGLGCVVCEISAKNAQKRNPSKIEILAMG